jgi:hypothetical protein
MHRFYIRQMGLAKKSQRCVTDFGKPRKHSVQRGMVIGEAPKVE